MVSRCSSKSNERGKRTVKTRSEQANRAATSWFQLLSIEYLRHGAFSVGQVGTHIFLISTIDVSESGYVDFEGALNFLEEGVS